MLNAGSDTTASGLTNTLFLLATHPDTLAKLRRELYASMAPDAIMPDFNVTHSVALPPGMPGGVPAAASPGGHWSAKGRACRRVDHMRSLHPRGRDRVRANLGAESASGSLPAARRVRPRSLVRRYAAAKPEGVCAAVSIGGRACIGRNLAMVELTKVIATFVNRYAVELLQDELAFVERFNMNPGAYQVRLTPRQGT